MKLNGSKMINLLASIVLLHGFSLAMSQDNSCVLLQKLANNLGCIGASGSFAQDNQKNFTDETITSSFGDGQCQLAKSLDESKSAQKKECQNWLNEQKKELGSRFITGNCKPQCSPCQDTMQKCTTTGEVRYRLDNRK